MTKWEIYQFVAEVKGKKIIGDWWDEEFKGGYFIPNGNFYKYEDRWCMRGKWYNMPSSFDSGDWACIEDIHNKLNGWEVKDD